MGDFQGPRQIVPAAQHDTVSHRLRLTPAWADIISDPHHAILSENQKIRVMRSYILKYSLHNNPLQTRIILALSSLHFLYLDRLRNVSLEAQIKESIRSLNVKGFSAIILQWIVSRSCWVSGLVRLQQWPWRLQPTELGGRVCLI